MIRNVLREYSEHIDRKYTANTLARKTPDTFFKTNRYKSFADFMLAK